MALEKVAVVDQVEVVESNVVQVRTDTRIIENGQIISSSYHRHVIVPGADYSNEVPKVQAICAAVHTPEVITAYEAAMAQVEGPGHNN